MVSEEDHSDGLKGGAGPSSSSSSSRHAEDDACPEDGWNPTLNQDEAIRKQEETIGAEIAARNSLIGDRIPLDLLLDEYSEEDQVYRCKIFDLKKIYGTMRKSRPDGNCFFRAFGFSLFHSLLQEDGKEIDRLIHVAEAVRQDLHALGFSFTVDDFYEAFVETLQDLKEGRIRTPEQLLEQVFNDSGKSDYLVVFLRLITSSHLQKNSEFFQAFIEDGLSVKEFCQHEVEPMYKESDHIHVIAITAAIGVGVRINYLDRGGSAEKINVHDFPDGVQNPKIHLLYRPGHYDVLYPRDNVTESVEHINADEGRIDSHVTSSNTKYENGESSDLVTDEADDGQKDRNSVHEGSETCTRSHTDAMGTVSSSSSRQQDSNAATGSNVETTSSSASDSGASSSKNPRLDPSIVTSSANEDSNEPSTTS